MGVYGAGKYGEGLYGSGGNDQRAAVVTWAAVGFPIHPPFPVTGEAVLSGRGDLNAAGDVSLLVRSGTVEAEADLYAVGELQGFIGVVEAEADVTGVRIQAGQGAEVVVSGTAILTPGETPLHDTFTGANGTLLENHVADSGAIWTRHASSTDSAELDTNRVRGSVGTGPALYYASTVPTSADYTVKAVVYCASNTGALAFTGRFDVATGFHYLMIFYSGFGWCIGRDVGSGIEFLDDFAGPTSLTVGASYTAELVMVGDRIAGYVDGSPLVSATDSMIVDAGAAGVRLDARTSGTGYLIDTIDMVAARVTVSLTGAGTLTAVGDIVGRGEAALTGAGTLAASGKQTAYAAAALTGAGDLTAAGTVGGNQIVTGAATMNGSGALTAAPSLTVYAAATMTGLGRLSAIGGRLLLDELDPSGLVLVPMGEGPPELVPMAAGSFTLDEQEKS